MSFCYYSSEQGTQQEASPSRCGESLSKQTQRAIPLALAMVADKYYYPASRTRNPCILVAALGAAILVIVAAVACFNSSSSCKTHKNSTIGTTNTNTSKKNYSNRNTNTNNTKTKKKRRRHSNKIVFVDNEDIRKILAAHNSTTGMDGNSRHGNNNNNTSSSSSCSLSSSSTSSLSSTSTTTTEMQTRCLSAVFALASFLVALVVAKDVEEQVPAIATSTTTCYTLIAVVASVLWMGVRYLGYKRRAARKQYPWIPY